MIGCGPIEVVRTMQRCNCEEAEVKLEPRMTLNELLSGVWIQVPDNLRKNDM